MTNPLGLDQEAKERRKRFLTASDAKHIVDGSWSLLWRRKMGFEDEDNLDDELRVQMGSYTEPFNLWWYCKKTGRAVAYHSDNEITRAAWEAMGGNVRDEWVVSKEYPFMGCSLDATSTTSKGHDCVLDAKHVGTFRYDELVERYTPAMTHQSIVCEVDWWALSVFLDNSRWELVEQAVDPFFREELIEREQEFWGYVERQEEPPDMTEPAAVPKPQARLRQFIADALGTPGWQQMVAVNNWLPDAANAAAQFAETLAAAKANGAARTAFGAALPDDIGDFRFPTSRGLFSAKRSAAGSLTLTVKEGK